MFQNNHQCLLRLVYARFRIIIITFLSYHASGPPKTELNAQVLGSFRSVLVPALALAFVMIAALRHAASLKSVLVDKYIIFVQKVLVCAVNLC